MRSAQQESGGYGGSHRERACESSYLYWDIPTETEHKPEREVFGPTAQRHLRRSAAILRFFARSFNELVEKHAM
jgi:hypothetical protein